MIDDDLKQSTKKLKEIWNDNRRGEPVNWVKESRHSKDHRTKEQVLSEEGILLGDGYPLSSKEEIPREIMHARFLEHHARSRRLYGPYGFDNDTVVDLLYEAAKEIRELYEKVSLMTE